MKQRFIVTTSIVLAMLVSSIDTTILHTTMPIIAGELGQFHLFAWSFTSYVLASTSLMPIAGRLADLIGRKRLFVTGVTLFLLGSVLCGSAVSMAQLVLYRAVQGLGAGVMMPLVQIIAADLYSVAQRGRIQALFTSMWMLSALLAPVLGAFFVELASWRWIFYINIPVCLICLAMIVPYRDVKVDGRKPIDVLGALLFVLGTTSLLFVTAAERNHLLWLALGVSVLTLFVIHERRFRAPMIPGALFARPAIAWMLVNNFIICVAMFGLPNYLPLYLQGNGYSVLASGLALIFISVGWMVASVGSGTWVLRFGYRSLLIVSNTLLLTAAVLLTTTRWVEAMPFLFLCLTVLGLAFGLTFTVSIIGSQQLVAEADKGISTSLQLFVRNTGLAVGVSVMGLMMNESPDVSAGMHNIYIYGLIGSVLAFISVFFVRESARSTVEREAVE